MRCAARLAKQGGPAPGAGKPGDKNHQAGAKKAFGPCWTRRAARAEWFEPPNK